MLESEDARFAAMVRSDTAQLREALDDSLSYVHSTGRRETKEQYLITLGSGALRYQEFTPLRRDVTLLGSGAATVVGLAHVRAIAAGQSRTFEVWYTAVYRLAGRWRLTAWQTTLTPAAVAPAQGSANLLPAPRGASGVGRVTYHWVDSSRAETFGPDRGARREVLVDVWYPANRDSTRPAAPYLPGLELVRRAIGDSAARRRYAPAYAAVEAGRLQSHAIEDARAQCGRGGCPVLIFSHGGGVDRSLYTVQFEDYASHGYVVAAIAHPYLTHTVVFPDGRVVRSAARPRDSVPPDTTLRAWQRQMASTRAWADRRAGVGAADVRFVIDQLTRLSRNASLGAPFAGQLNLEQIGALGHSMGGRVAATACQLDRRIKACLNQDGISGGVPFSRDAQGNTMRQPFMYLGRREPTPPPLADSVRAALQMTPFQDDSLIRALPLQQTALLADMPAGAWRVRLTVRDVVHMSFSDEIVIQAADDSSKRNPALLASSVIEDYTRAFFDKTLLGSRNTLLDRPADSSLVLLERFDGRSRRPSY